MGKLGIAAVGGAVASTFDPDIAAASFGSDPVGDMILPITDNFKLGLDSDSLLRNYVNGSSSLSSSAGWEKAGYIFLQYFIILLVAGYVLSKANEARKSLTRRSAPPDNASPSLNPSNPNIQ